MNVVLRKSDSATSLLLFIYNNYLTQYNKDTLKLSSILEIMKAFGKSETATRMALSRTVKAGILINQNVDSEVCYSLAPVGKESISTWNQGIYQFWKRYALRNKPWDKKWYLLNLEFGEKHKEDRAVMLERLQQIGFGVLNTNTWITPYYQPDEIQKFIMEFNVGKGLVEMHGDMIIHQDGFSFVEEVFDFKKLEKLYKNFIETFGEKFEETKKISEEKWFIDNGHALPLLHAIGWEFFFIATVDAAIPKSLYPEWAGDEAALLMRDFRSIILEATTKYLGKFD